MKAWYAVYTQPGKEALAAINLRRQGFDVYLPQLRKKRSHARQVEWVASPFFPRYIFVSIDLMKARWRAIHSTIGVSHLVCFGDRPLRVPSLVIDGLKAQENKNGYIEFTPPTPFGRGDIVRVIDGAFSDSLGVIERLDDQGRVTMLLNLMGRQVKTKTSLQNVAAAG